MTDKKLLLILLVGNCIGFGFVSASLYLSVKLGMYWLFVAASSTLLWVFCSSIYGVLQLHWVSMNEELDDA